MQPVTKKYAPEKGLSAAEIDARVDAVLAETTLEEKTKMMSGAGFFRLYAESNKHWGAHPYPAGGGVERLDIPPLYFTDGPRGVARGNSTCFPCTMARGASFDIDLERRIGEIMGIEARAQGCTLSGAVCVNLLRHPGWGRAQEVYGEDSHHLGEMGAALAVGIQTHNVIATVKHFALNSIENARFTVDVVCDGRTMREVYLPHFKRILDAGCATVMSAYNKWNGEYCGQHRELLTDILRGEWGFEGFVHSDWVFGVRKVYGAAAGLDVENPEPLVYSGLMNAVETGGIEPGVIDTACRRILKTQYRFACAEDPFETYTPDLAARPAHVAVAREAAQKSAVLLKNDGVLPFDAAKVKTLAVLGRLAALKNTGDNGSSRVRPPYVVTALEGLTARVSKDAVLTGDESDLAAAAKAAEAADAVVVVVGLTADEEGEYIPGGGIDLGEVLSPGHQALARSNGGMVGGDTIGGDRVDLSLPADQIALIKAVAKARKPMVVVIVAGSAVMVEEWIDMAPAVLQTFYAGMEGGSALADLLFGDVSPSARLPFTVAKRAEDYPFFDRDAKSITYDLYHGYTLLERNGVAPRFGFGHGLSYAAFDYRALKLRATDATIEVQVSVRNTGSVAADEIVLAFAHSPQTYLEGPKRLLRAFARVTLEPGEQRQVRLSIRRDDLRRWDMATAQWVFVPGAYGVEIAGREGESVSSTVMLA
jgi:beta-glucosidase